MRVLTCLAFEHDLSIVLLAVCVCLLGSYVSVTLFRRALTADAGARLHWTFLAAFTAGAAIWTTHFIAMLGYRANVPVTLDGTLTIVSALVAVVGITLGLHIASAKSRMLAAIGGGGTIGLAIAAMHYVGMSAYRVEGVIRWLPEYIIASICLSTGLGIALIAVLRKTNVRRSIVIPTAILVSAIVLLHFTGMAAFSVVPLPGVSPSVDPELWSTMAAAVAMVALMILGTGVSTHLIELRTYSQSQDELSHIAMHDALTELANRHSFTEALKHECDRLFHGTGAFALLMIDLDRFKPINETLGHPAGDCVLQKVSQRLRCAVRKGDLVARLGGDEFAVILRDTSDLAQVTMIVDRIVEVLQRPFLINGNVAELSGSVGIALAPAHGKTAQELVQHAGVALYSAKRSGREHSCMFRPELMYQITRRRLLEIDLRRACTRGDFTVVYQPVFDARTKVVSGAEALLRWHSADRGEVPPSEFIPIAEELGLVTRIGAEVLRQACRDAAQWDSDLDIAVNISPVQLLDPRLTQTVRQALDEAGLDPSRLELEITETALLGNDEVAFRTLSRLQDLGVRISLDDFGTGYSSLSYLHRFPIDRIKIDRSFVQRLPHDAGSVSIVRAIAQLGNSLGLQITAEGIETEEQYDFIVAHGCHSIQGFLISKPLTVEDMRKLLGSRARRAAA